MKLIRLFISSPGDVGREREATRRVLDRLQSEFFEHVTLAPYFWEWEPVDFSQDFQSQIPSTADFDIVICLLWSKLGSRLGEQYKLPPDHTETASSGTQYELMQALHGKQQHPEKLPDLLVWVNKSPSPPASSPPFTRQEEDEMIRQRRALQDFLATITRETSTGVFTAAVNQYEVPTEDFGSYQYLDEFEDMMDRKLRKLIQKHIGARTVKPRPQWPGSPFRDLDVFEFEHAPIFFGRSRAVGEVVRLLQHTLSKLEPCHFALVLGASGSGKSSLARAGVLPLLTRPGVIEGIGLWRCAIVRPSDDSADLFQALASALLNAGKTKAEKKPGADSSTGHLLAANPQPPALPELADSEAEHPQKALAAELREHPRSVAIRVKDQLNSVAKAQHAEQRRVLEDQITRLTQEGRPADAALKQQALKQLQEPKARLVLLLDQMEELFTLNYAAEQLRAFLETIDILARSGRVFVIGTLRSDFYPRYQEQPALVGLARDGARFDLLPPTPDEISQIIRRPASLAGLEFEKHPTTAEHTLADSLRDEALADAEALPLLEHVLNRLYHAQLSRKDGCLSFADHAALGGVGGALGKHAEDIFTGQHRKAGDPPPPWTEETFRVIFGCLITFGKGEGDTDVPNRRAFTYQDLIQGDAAAQALVDTFIHERLLIADKDSQSRAIVRVSHEALLTRWPRLNQWLQTAAVRDFISMRRRLIESERQWREQKRNKDCLLPSGLRLEEGRQLLKDHAAALTPEEKEFIRESSEHHEARQREALELETRRRKEAERLQAAAERQRRLALRFAALVFVMVIVAVVSAYWARKAKMVALEAQILAVEAKALAEKREHGAKAMVFLMKADAAGDAETALALTKAAVLEQSTQETRSALLKCLLQAPPNFGWAQKVGGGGVSALAWNRDSTLLAIGARNGAIYLAQADGSVTTLAEGHGQQDKLDGVLDLAFAEEGSVIVALHESGVVRRYLRQRGAKPWEGRVGSAFLVLGAVSADAGQMALADPTAFRVEAGKLPGDKPLPPEPIALPEGAEAACFRFSPNATRLAIGNSSGGVSVQMKGRLTECRAADGKAVLSAGWQRGDVLACGVVGKGVEVWDIGNIPRLTAQVPLADVNVTSLDWSPVRETLAGAAKKRVRLWQMKSGGDATQALVELPFAASHQSTINTVRWATHGRGLVSGDDLGVVKMWSTQQPGPICFLETGRALHGLDMSADRQWIAVGAESGQVLVWNTTTQSLLHEFAMGNAAVNCLAWRPGGGGSFACADKQGQIQFFDSPKGAAKAVPGHEGEIWQMVWSPDGRLLFSTGSDGMVRAWDHAAGTSKVIHKIQDAALGLAASPDSARVAIGSATGQLSVVRLADGAQEFSQKLHADSIGSISWSKDGRRIASAGNDGVVVLCDEKGGNAVRLLPPNSEEEDPKYLEAVAFSPDGARVAAAGQDGRLLVWDTADGSLQWQGAVHSKAVYQLRWVTEDTLLTASMDGKICRIDPSEKRWIERAAELTRHLPAVSNDEVSTAPPIHSNDPTHP